MERQIKKVKNQVSVKYYDQGFEDMQYWLSKKPEERIAAVTYLINQNLLPGQRMDKTIFSQRKLK